MRFLSACAALVLMLGLALGPAHANDLSNATWSETDASNNSASPNGWTTGTMLPSQVEPTARAMMGALRRWYDHTNATVTSGGSANAQTLTYSVAPAAYVAGDCYAFIAGFANTGALTLNVNALGALAVKQGSAALAGGELVAGQAVVSCLDATAANFQLLPSASTLSNSGVTPGTYTKVTVDAKGRATSGATAACADLSNGASGCSTAVGTAATHNVGDFFQTANNLSEGTPATMRSNLGLGTAATQNTGTFFQVANNLSEGTAATMRSNLGLGTAATQNTGTSGGTLPLLNGTNTWSGTQTFGPVLGAVSTQSGTTYTLAASDCGTTIRFTNSSAVTLTTLNSLSAGCAIAIYQAGAGQVTISDGSGATHVSRSSYTKTAGQAAILGLFVDQNSGGSAAEFVITGDGA